MRFKTLVFGTLFIFGLLLTSGISYGYERAIEAEMADAIEEPLAPRTLPGPGPGHHPDAAGAGRERRRRAAARYARRPPGLRA